MAFRKSFTDQVILNIELGPREYQVQDIVGRGNSKHRVTEVEARVQGRGAQLDVSECRGKEWKSERKGLPHHTICALQTIIKTLDWEAMGGFCVEKSYALLTLWSLATVLKVGTNVEVWILVWQLINAVNFQERSDGVQIRGGSGWGKGFCIWLLQLTRLAYRLDMGCHTNKLLALECTYLSIY